MKAEVTITFKGVTITLGGDDNYTHGSGMAGLIARLIYMHDLDNAGTSENQIGPELKKMLDSKYSNTPKPPAPLPPWGVGH